MSSHVPLSAGLFESGQDVEEVLVTSAATQEAGLESGSGSEETQPGRPSSGRSRLGIVFALVGTAAVAASVAFFGRGSSTAGTAASSSQSWQEDGVLYAEPEVVREGPFEEEFTELYNTYGYKQSSPNYMGTPMQTSSSSGRFVDCVLCSPNQCTIDYSGKGHWASCPSSAKYFSKSQCGCVSSLSKCIGKQASCSQLCVDCSSKSCYGNGKYNKCAKSTPYFMATRNTCASSCSPAPGPAPKPQWGASGSSGPSPAPAPAPSSRRRKTSAPASSSRRRKPSKTNGKCEKSVGSTCMMTNCAKSRGQVECGSMYQCTCKKGYCADKKGKCVAEGRSEERR